MSTFTFPQPGERANAATIPVAEHTLAALYALALVGRDHLTDGDDSYVIPQCEDALREIVVVFNNDHYKAAVEAAHEMEQALREEHPF